MRAAVAIVCAGLLTGAITAVCSVYGEPIFGFFGGIAAGCALLKLAEKVGWA